MSDSQRSFGRRHGALLLGALGLLALLLQAWGFHDLRQDDPFITFRYGVNLALGHGLVFNPGEPLMGSTSPGQALLSALLYLATGLEGLPTVMALLGCLGWTAQAAGLFVLLRRAAGDLGALLIALAVAAGLATPQLFVLFETHLTVALSIWALVAAHRSRWIAAAALCALAGLFRPDAYLLAVLLLIPAARELRLKLWQPALAFLALTLPWLLFAQLTYGTVIPQSAVSKFHRATFGDYAAHLLQHPGPMLTTVRSLAAAVGCWLAAAAGAALLIRADRRLWPLVAWPALHLGGYLYLRPFVGHDWHLYAPTLVVLVLALGAVAVLSRQGKTPLLRHAGAAVLCVLAALYAARTLADARTHGQSYWLGARDASYRRTAAFLRRHASPRDRVALTEVGTVAYYSGLPVFDLGGLVSPRGATTPRDVAWLVTNPRFMSKLKEGRRVVATFKEGDWLTWVVDLRRRRRGL